MDNGVNIKLPDSCLQIPMMWVSNCRFNNLKEFISVQKKKMPVQTDSKRKERAWHCWPSVSN